MVWALRAHSSKTGSKKGAGRRAGHCMHHRQCACAAKTPQKFLLWRNPLLLFGRSLLERGGCSADFQGEVGFCRSTCGLFTSCSSTHIRTSSSRTSSCRPRRNVDKISPLAACCGAPAPADGISPRRAPFLRAAPLDASHTHPMHPCNPPAPPRSALAASHLLRAHLPALGRGSCGMHRAWPSPPRCSAPLWPQVVILDFLDTYSSRSRRWCHQFVLFSLLLLPIFRRGTGVVGGDIVGLACRRGRRAHFFADGGVFCVDVLSCRTYTSFTHSPGCRRARHAASTTLAATRREKAAQH